MIDVLLIALAMFGTALGIAAMARANVAATAAEMAATQAFADALACHFASRAAEARIRLEAFRGE